MSNWRLPEHIYPGDTKSFAMLAWHTFKRLGFDIERGQMPNSQCLKSEKLFKRCQKITYMLSPSRFATEKFISSFNLAKLNKADCIIEKVIPEMIFFYNFTDEDIIRVKNY